MNALETLANISETNLAQYNLRCCLVDKDKHPLKVDGSPCRPNVDEDFVSLEDLLSADLEQFCGIGISITASNIYAIDVDHCFSQPFDITSIDNRGIDIIEMFKEFAYIEFSFSGTGLRVLFLGKRIDNYNILYYIKNSGNQIEYYQPSGSARYVTITGKAICNNPIREHKSAFIKTILFLKKYMKKPEVQKRTVKVIEKRTLEECLFEVKRLCLKNSKFYDIWNAKAPGSHSNESELDYGLIAFLYEYITQDRDMVRQIFEHSNLYKTKDRHHINKWLNNDYRYFNFQFDNVERGH